MNTNRQADPSAASLRKTSLAAGILYLLTFVSIPTLSIYSQVKSANYILGAGPDTPAMIGALSEVIVALAGIGTAVVLFPVLKKYGESLALGLVASRILEAATIFLCVTFILAIVSLRQAAAGAGALVVSETLVNLYNRVFLVGQSLLPALNDVLLGYLLYKSRLVPRALSLIGIVGAPVLIVAFLAMLFGLVARDAPVVGLFALPVALFEFSLGLWLTFKGFNRSAITSEPGRTVTNEAISAA